MAGNSRGGDKQPDTVDLEMPKKDHSPVSSSSTPAGIKVINRNEGTLKIVLLLEHKVPLKYFL